MNYKISNGYFYHIKIKYLEIKYFITTFAKNIRITMAINIETSISTSPIEEGMNRINTLLSELSKKGEKVNDAFGNLAQGASGGMERVGAQIGIINDIVKAVEAEVERADAKVYDLKNALAGLAEGSSDYNATKTKLELAQKDSDNKWAGYLQFMSSMNMSHATSEMAEVATAFADIGEKSEEAVATNEELIKTFSGLSLAINEMGNAMGGFGDLQFLEEYLQELESTLNELATSRIKQDEKDVIIEEPTTGGSKEEEDYAKRQEEIRLLKDEIIKEGNAVDILVNSREKLVSLEVELAAAKERQLHFLEEGEEREAAAEQENINRAQSLIEKEKELIQVAEEASTLRLKREDGGQIYDIINEEESLRLKEAERVALEEKKKLDEEFGDGRGAEIYGERIADLSKDIEHLHSRIDKSQKSINETAPSPAPVEETKEAVVSLTEEYEKQKKELKELEDEYNKYFAVLEERKLLKEQLGTPFQKERRRIVLDEDLARGIDGIPASGFKEFGEQMDSAAEKVGAAREKVEELEEQLQSLNTYATQIDDLTARYDFTFQNVKVTPENNAAFAEMLQLQEKLQGIGKDELKNMSSEQVKEVVSDIGRMNELMDQLGSKADYITHLQEEFVKLSASCSELYSQIEKLPKDAKNFDELTGQYDEEKARLDNVRAQLVRLGVDVGKLNGEAANGINIGKELTAVVTTLGGKLGVNKQLLGLVTTGTIGTTAAIGAATAAVVEATKRWAEYNTELGRQDERVRVSLEMTGKEAEVVTNKLRALSRTYGVDFNNAVSSVNTLMFKFGLTSEQAMDILSKGMQGMVRGDGSKLLSMIDRYGAGFKAAGLEASQLVAIIQNTEGGIFGDEHMQAIQFGLRNIRTMSKSTQDALKGIGIDVKKMMADMQGGSLTTFEALQKVAVQMQKVDMSSQNAGKVLSLFGRAGAMQGEAVFEAIAGVNTNLEETARQTGEIGEAMALLEEKNVALEEAFRSLFGYNGWEEMKIAIETGFISALTDVINYINDVCEGLKFVADYGNDLIAILNMIISPVETLIAKFIDLGDFGVDAVNTIGIALYDMLNPMGAVLHLLRSIGENSTYTIENAKYEEGQKLLEQIDREIAEETQRVRAHEREQFTKRLPKVGGKKKGKTFDAASAKADAEQRLKEFAENLQETAKELAERNEKATIDLLEDSTARAIEQLNHETKKKKDALDEQLKKLVKESQKIEKENWMKGGVDGKKHTEKEWAGYTGKKTEEEHREAILAKEVKDEQGNITTIGKLRLQMMETIAKEDEKKRKEIYDAEKKAMLDYYREYGSQLQKVLAVRKSAEMEKVGKNEWEKATIDKQAAAQEETIKADELLKAIDWAALFEGVGSMTQETASLMRDQIKTLMASDKFKTLDTQTQEKLVSALGDIRQMIGSDVTATWSQLGELMSQFQQAQADYAAAKVEEQNALLAMESTRTQINDLNGQDNVDPDTLASLNILLKEQTDHYNELAAKTVEAEQSVRALGQQANSTVAELKNFVSPGAAKSEKENWAWKGVDGYSELQNFQQQIGQYNQDVDQAKEDLQNNTMEEGKTFFDELGKKLDSGEITQEQYDAASEEWYNKNGKAIKGEGDMMTDIAGGFGGIMEKLMGRLMNDLIGELLGNTVGFVLQIPKMILQLSDMIKNLVTGILDSFTELLKFEWLQDLINSITGAIANLIEAVFKLPEQLFHVLHNIIKDGIGGMYGAVIQTVMSAVGLGKYGPDTWFKGSGARLAKEIEKLEEKNTLLIESLDSLRDAFERQAGMQAVATYEQAVEMQKEISKNHQKIIEDQMRYSHAHSSWMNEWGGFTEEQIARLSKQLGREFKGTAEEMLAFTAEDWQIVMGQADIWEAIGDTGKGGYGGRVQEKIRAFVEQAGSLDDLLESLYETLTDISFDSLFDSFVSTLSDMDSTAEDFAEDFEEYLKNAVIKSMAIDMFRDRLEDWRKAFADRMSSNDDGVFLTPEEKEELLRTGGTYTDMETGKQKSFEGWETISQDGLAFRDMIKELLDFGSSSYKQEASSKGWQSMGQDTAEELNGRFTALQIAGESINTTAMLILDNLNTMAMLTQNNADTFSELRDLAVTRNSYLEDIARYTKRIPETMEMTMNNIYNRQEEIYNAIRRA